MSNFVSRIRTHTISGFNLSTLNGFSRGEKKEGDDSFSPKTKTIPDQKKMVSARRMLATHLLARSRRTAKQNTQRIYSSNTEEEDEEHPKRFESSSVDRASSKRASGVQEQMGSMDEGMPNRILLRSSLC